VNRGAALIGALLATLATPATWPLALGTFLVRGGILLFALPVLALPSPVGIANVLSPTVIAVALGTMTSGLAISLVAVGLAAAILLGFGGWLAAVLEAEGVRIIAADEDIRAIAGPVGAGRAPNDDLGAGGPGGTAGRILAARLVAYVPLGLAVVAGSFRLGSRAYGELTAPGDVGTPFVVRVLLGSPEVVIALVVTWMVGEILGAVAVRRIVLRGDTLSGSLRGALGVTVRHPLATLARFWLPTVALFAVIVPSMLAASAAWGAARAALADLEDPADPVGVLGTVVVFVGLWLVGLVLAGVVSAWRAAVWTAAEMAGEGTFGASAGIRPGDWRNDRSSATL